MMTSHAHACSKQRPTPTTMSCKKLSRSLEHGVLVFVEDFVDDVVVVIFVVVVVGQTTKQVVF